MVVMMGKNMDDDDREFENGYGIDDDWETENDTGLDDDYNEFENGSDDE